MKQTKKQMGSKGKKDTAKQGNNAIGEKKEKKGQRKESGKSRKQRRQKGRPHLEERDGVGDVIPHLSLSSDANLILVDGGL